MNEEPKPRVPIEDRPTGDRPTGDSASFRLSLLGEGPELARLLRFRLAGTALMWALGLAWRRVGASEVHLALLNASAGASLLVTAATIIASRERWRPWLAELHVAADLVILPAFVYATGGWHSPLSAVLVTKGVAGSMLIGPARGTAYAVGCIVVSFATWIWQVSEGAEGQSLFALAAGPAVVAGASAVLGLMMLRAASFPLDLYRSRRRELVSENRRLEDAIAELESQNRRLVALHGLARDIGSLGRLEEVAVRLRDAVLRTFPGHSVSFFLFDRDSGWLRPILLPEGTDTHRAAKLSGPDGPLVREMGRPGPVPGSSFAFLDQAASSQVLVPLRMGERPVGMMVLEDRHSVSLPDADRQLLATMGHELAIALRNAELHARTVELRDSLQSLIDHANALILVVDPLGSIEVANRALASLASPGAPLEGRPAGEILTPASATEFARALEVVRGGTPVENLTLAIRHGQDGQGERRAVFNLAPVNRDGVFRSAIAVGQDITRMELLERGIVQSEKLASLGQFVAGIAHEMNNPLTAITAYGDYLRNAHRKGETPSAGDQAAKLDEIVIAGERIQGFVQSLLGLARPSSGLRRGLEINAVIADAVRLCHYDLRRASLEVKTEFGSDLPWIRGVEAELQQVFINLFTNASHAMSAGGMLSVRTGIHGDGVRVTVSDNGRGIKAADLPKIFEAFFTTKEEGRGTGLGLSIVKTIVEQHGGQISVESDEGKGTTFLLDFPKASREGRAVTSH